MMIRFGRFSESYLTMFRCISWLLLVLLLSIGAIAEPAIVLSKRLGPPTSRILVSGSGFAPRVGVDIFFDTKDEALVVTNDGGQFRNAAITVSPSAYPGEHWVTALERDNSTAAQNPFVVFTDWPQFHVNDQHTGFNTYENILNPTNVGSLSIRWSFLTRNDVTSSPAVVDGVVYLGANDGNLYALKATTGALLWQYNLGSYVFSSPAVANGVIYVGSFYGDVYALNARTGALLWKYITGDEVSSPAVANGIVYVGSADNNVYALDAATGVLLWKYSTGAAVVSSPAVTNDVVYVGSYDSNVYALNAKDGSLQWKYPTNQAVQSSPSVVNGVVYVGSYDNNMYALNAGTGNLIWKYATYDTVFTSPAVANGVVYFGSADQNLYALDALTGAFLWSYHSRWFMESPAVANGVVYVASQDDNVFALDGKTGALLWRYTSGNTVYASPVVTNGTLYISLGGSYDYSLYAFALPGGDTVHSSTAPPAFSTLHPELGLHALSFRR